LSLPSYPISEDNIKISDPELDTVAIVVLSYNGKDLLHKFLPPIIATAPAYAKVYVIDNASIDGTYVWLQANFPNITIVRLQVNKGFTNGYVEGLKSISAKYYVLISSDVEVSPNWVEPIIQQMEADPTVGLAQPKIKSYNNKTQYEYSGAAGAYIDSLGYPFCRGRVFFTIEEDNGQYDDIAEVFWCSGACMFIRADVYHQLNGFDNDYYAHMEDIDISWRAKNAGYKVIVVPQSIVYHVGGHIISYGSPPKIFRNYKNGLIMMTKNLPAGQLVWKLPIRLLLDITAAYRALFQGNTKEYFAIMKAHLQYFLGIFIWFKKRKNARAEISATPNTTGVFKGSVVWRYFILGRKTFNNL